MAIHDIKHKIIRQPDMNLLTMPHIYDDYFWRFIKILSKFHHYIYHNIWNVDENTLKYIKTAYKLKFESWTIQKMQKFVKRLLFWDLNVHHVNYRNDLETRLMMLHKIGFDKHLNDA